MHVSLAFPRHHYQDHDVEGKALRYGRSSVRPVRTVCISMNNFVAEFDSNWMLRQTCEKYREVASLVLMLMLTGLFWSCDQSSFSPVNVAIYQSD